MNRHSRSGAFALGLLLSLTAIPGYADDTEIFVATAGAGNSGIQPNILFILDTSGSMDTDVQTQNTYDPNVIHAGSCDNSRVYWVQGSGGSVPSCSGNGRWFRKANNTCDAAVSNFSNTGVFIGKAARYRTTGNWNRRNKWNNLSQNSTAQNSEYVECQADSGVHGNGVNGAQRWARNGGPWTGNQGQEINWGGLNTYTLYDANYLNWYYSPAGATQTRLEIMQQVTKDLLDSISGVNVGLMRFSNNHSGSPSETRAEGGMVVHQMQDVGLARGAMKTAIDNFKADGYTPLSESMYEAGQYYAGRKVDFGLNSKGNNNASLPSIPASRMATNQALYASPIEYSCQENYIVLLTDGLPTEDTNANASITALPNFGTLVGTSCDGSGDGACLDDMSEYMFKGDLSSLNGQQSVKTYTIGFVADFPLLKETAENAGGKYFTATDTASLTTALTQTVLSILDDTTTFTAPTISVNAFNRTQNLNDLFISVFQASGTEHWPGNMKKYEMVNGVIVDAAGNPAVDPGTGFFYDSARSIWSTAADGPNATEGGAAKKIPNPGSRNIYTYTGSDLDLIDSTNRLDNGNLALTDAMLAIGNAGDPARGDLLDWARGRDVLDEDQDNDTMDTRGVMGDPLHAKPVTVIYGGTVLAPDLNDAVILTASNDGYLHAIDAVTGVELWSFVPPQLLPGLKDLYFDDLTPDKHYGLDGNLRTVVTDVNRNGIIEPLLGDSVHLYFGMRRGGESYFALDVTSKTAPILMWMKDSTNFPLLAQTWSTPTPAVVKIDTGGLQKDVPVMIFGGGYDDTQDNYSYTTDSIGNSIYMVDALTGALIWWASGDAGETASNHRYIATMQNSIPGDIRVLDMNGDGLADRMYAADMGGRIFRLDINNGKPVSNLVAGGAFASLGAADLSSPQPMSATRRFYYAPDTSLITSHGTPYINIAIGSGYRAHPLDTGVIDRFYALRDYNVFGSYTQAQYDILAPITDSDPNLIDVTADPNAVVPLGSIGWKLTLLNPGEKVLAESRTFDNKTFFTTFEPGGNVSSCAPTQGQNRLYAVSALNASPFSNLDPINNPDPNDPSILNTLDRVQNLNAGGIAPEVVFLFPSPDDPDTCVGPQCTPPPECLVGLETCDANFNNAPVRTFWSQAGAE